MKDRIKHRLIRALRSGKYIQGVNGLKHNGTHCVLGVLCDLYMRTHPKERCREDDNGYFGSTTHLPAKVQDWAGTDRDPHVSASVVGMGADWNVTISCLNDGLDSAETPIRQHTFAEIADILERNIV